MKIVFFGTSNFSVLVLESLIQSDNFSVVLVVTEPPKPTGRKKELTPSPVYQFSERFGLSTFTPESLKTKEARKKILSFKPKVIVVAAYGNIIPEEIFNFPLLKTVNIHPSLLPKLRGPSPIQYALLKGLDETGVSLMLVDKEFDHGQIISQKKIKISPDDTYDTLETKLAQLGAELLIRDLPKYARGELKPWEQNHSQATFTKKITKEDGLIDWDKSAGEIYNQWRAFCCWPGIYTIINNSRFNLKKIKIAQNIGQKETGKMFSNEKKLFISCGDGVVEIEEIQPAGRKIMAAQSFINGYQDVLSKKEGS